METVEYRWRQVDRVVLPGLPPIRSSKEWRRYQVMLKRMSAEIDRQLMAAMLGTSFPAPPPTSYPPKPPKRRSVLDISNIA